METYQKISVAEVGYGAISSHVELTLQNAFLSTTRPIHFAVRGDVIGGAPTDPTNFGAITITDIIPSLEFVQLRFTLVRSRGTGDVYG